MGCIRNGDELESVQRMERSLLFVFCEALRGSEGMHDTNAVDSSILTWNTLSIQRCSQE